MRTHLIFLLLLLPAIVFTGCRDKAFKTYQANVPIYQSFEDWRNTEVELEAPQAIRRPGKIYIYQNYLFVNEYLLGVHVIDNTNPAAPQIIGFLPVLGNSELAIRNDVLYLDSYIDLLAFDISNKSQPVLRHRLQDVFEFEPFHHLPGFNWDFPMALLNPEKGVVIDWTVELITEESDLVNYYYPQQWAFDRDFASPSIVNSSDGGSGGVGLGGSTAKFTITKDHLYAIGSWALEVFSLDGGPAFVQSIQLNRLPETLFPALDHLFIGTTTGMQVYDLSSPGNPTFRSEIVHINSCDPVAVNGDRAYVTLSRDRPCQVGQNMLMVIDITSLDDPETLFSFPMTNPKGLGVDQEKLFICDGNDGLKVFDRTDDATIDQSMLAHFSDIRTADVIPNPFNQVLIMTGGDGIFQYDYSDVNNIIQISHLPIQP